MPNPMPPEQARALIARVQEMAEACGADSYVDIVTANHEAIVNLGTADQFRALCDLAEAGLRDGERLDPTVRGEWVGIAIDGEPDATLAVRTRAAADRYVATFHPDHLVAVLAPFAARAAHTPEEG